MESLTAPPPQSPSPSKGAPPAAKVSTAAIVATMLKVSSQISDLIFSPGREPQVEISGQLKELNIAGVGRLTPEMTKRIATDLIGINVLVSEKLEKEGSTDLSYGLPGIARFRVNIFRQRGSLAIVMRVIPQIIPDFASLNLPPQLGEAANLRNGIVLVTGPTGSGKSSTLAAILNKINEEKAYHVLTIEDPIEFLHIHKKSTIHQRELHSDTPSFALALRAALRQAPKVILVGRNARQGDHRNCSRSIRNRATWSFRRCTPSMLQKPSSASSACFRSPISKPYGIVSPRLFA